MIEQNVNDDQISVAATCVATKTIGPGLRSIVWVQGCFKRCQGCNTPEWSPPIRKNLQSPQQLASRLLSVPDITGLTLSGGEPMLQAGALAEMVRLARQANPGLDVICYTGFTLQQLLQARQQPGIAALLEQVDVLIDGQYELARHEQNGVCGSNNQNIYFLTDRLKGSGLEVQPRWTEVRMIESEVMIVDASPVFTRHWFEMLGSSQTRRWANETL